MIYLNDKIVAYLTVNNIPFTSKNYTTAQPDGQPDQIIYWDKSILGNEPTETQLEEAYSIWEGQQISVKNKTTASQLLSETDWTSNSTISDPQYSNPYLGNQDEFLAYRSQIRQIAVNPPTTLVTFPEQPKKVWVNV